MHHQYWILPEWKNPLQVRCQINQDWQASSPPLLTFISNFKLPVTSDKFKPPLANETAKRKLENRSFQVKWETDYLFTNVKDGPVCLVCGANMAVTKN